MDHKTYLQTRDRLQAKLSRKLAELDRLESSQGGNWRRTKRLVALRDECDNLGRAIERCEAVAAKLMNLE